MAETGEFTRRSYLNHQMDLIQAEAVLDVIHVTNESALESAQKQLQGSLSKKIYEFSDQLLPLLAEVEAHIDFSEEGLPIGGDIEKKIGQFNSTNFRNYHSAQVSIAIVGHPKAGKSSLLNALLEEALVS